MNKEQLKKASAEETDLDILRQWTGKWNVGKSEYLWEGGSDADLDIVHTALRHVVQRYVALQTELSQLKQMVDAAVSFELLPEVTDRDKPYQQQVCLERRKQDDGSIKWAITRGSEEMSRTGRWEFAPSPSNRTKAYLARQRFDSIEQATEAFTAINGGTK